MTKNYKTLLAVLALGIGSVGASAQSVTVTLKDGTQHRFGTDYVKQITFEEVQPQAPAIAMTQLVLDVYSGGTNVTVTMRDAYGDNEFVLDTYLPTAANYLQTGTYAVGASEGFRVDTGSYSWVKAGETKKALKSGTLEISAEGKVYTIIADLVLDDDSKTRGKYIGELPSYAPYLEYALEHGSYNGNPQPAGQFYMKFQDAGWKVDMALVLCAAPEATELPDGEYTYADTAAPFTISPSSYIDTYSPNTSCRLMPGSKATVSHDGAKTVIAMEFVLDDGRTFTGTYSGEMSGQPLFEEPSSAPALKRGPVTPFPAAR